MKEERVYILQKDTPSCKAGTEFMWDENLFGYTCDVIDGSHNCHFRKESVESNPEWFKLKDEIKIVTSVWHKDEINFYTESNLCSMPFKVSRERLYEILIAESKTLSVLQRKDMLGIEKMKLLRKLKKHLMRAG